MQRNYIQNSYHNERFTDRLLRMKAGTGRPESNDPAEQNLNVSFFAGVLCQPLGRSAGVIAHFNGVMSCMITLLTVALPHSFADEANALSNP